VTALIAPMALTLTFIVTRLLGVTATAPGLPISMPASPAPLRCLSAQREPICEAITPWPAAAFEAPTGAAVAPPRLGPAPRRC